MDKREKTVAFVDGVLDGIRALPHTFEALLGHIERSYGKRRYAISFDEDGRKVGESYREMAALSRDLGSRLRQILGGKPSEAPVALKYRNSPEWPSLFYAILASGHPVLLLDARLPKANAENLLRQAGAIAIITNESEPFSVPSYRLADLKKARPGAKGAWADHVLFCSSGTTGDAKIVVFDGERAFAQIDSARDIASETQELVYDGPIRNFAMIPFHHIFGFVAVFLWFTALGKTLVYPSSMATKDLLYAIRKGRCTHVFSVPLLWDGVAQTIRRTFHLKGEKAERLLTSMVSWNLGEIPAKEAGIARFRFVQRLIRAKVLGNSPRFCITGGGYVSEDTLRLINGLGYSLSNGYGMTELGVTSVELSPDPKVRVLGSIGHPLHGVDYQLDGNELLVRAPSAHIALIVGGKAEKNDPSLLYRTGDIAEEHEGRWYIRGRSKDVIISSDGENVYPDEIEHYFKDVPHVRNAVAFGVQEGAKERIVLIVEPDIALEEASLKALGDALEEVNQGLQGSRKVDEMAVTSEPLPLANSMKVKRGAVRDEYLSHPENFQYFDGKKVGRKETVSFDGFPEEEVKEMISLVRDCFAENLSLPPSRIGDDDIWNQELGGDSMSYVSMIADLDERTGLDIPRESYGKVGTVRGFALLLLTLRHGSPAPVAPEDKQE